MNSAMASLLMQRPAPVIEGGGRGTKLLTDIPFGSISTRQNIPGEHQRWMQDAAGQH